MKEKEELVFACKAGSAGWTSSASQGKHGGPSPVVCPHVQAPLSRGLDRLPVGAVLGSPRSPGASVCFLLCL